MGEALAPELAAVRERLLTDTPYWARHCATILDVNRRPVKLEARPWQARTPDTPAHMTPLDEALEAQRLAGQPMRAIVGKARKLGFCLAPNTRVLTADLRWVAISYLTPGDEVLAVDESTPGGMGNKRKMRRAVVEAVREVFEQAYRVTMNNGRELVATGEHRFLCQRRGGTDADWRKVEKFRVGDRIRHLVEPWEPPMFEDGWFGGMIDGEGSLRGSPGGPCNIAVYQRPGAVHDRARAYLRDGGYTFREYHDDRSSRVDAKPSHKPGEHLTVSRTSEMLRLVGKTRPTRFVDDSSWWEGRELPKRSGSWGEIVAIEAIGPQRMIDLQTSTQTFIAEGFVSHNSTWVQAKFMQGVTQRPFDSALTVAHRRDAARTLFNMARLIYQRLPTQEQLGELIYGPGGAPAPFSVRPQWLGGTEVAQQDGGYMTLGVKGRAEEASTYQAMTAGGQGGGRASTPSKIHASEVAHWADAEYLTGLFNALPLIPDTIGIIESTAKGFNHFWELWDNAVRGAADPETGITWTPLFYGWQDNPFNMLPFISDHARERFEHTIGDEDGGGDDEEPWLVEEFGVTLEQLNWRRQIIAGPECRCKVEMFHQEHPATPEQMFIGSGAPVFPGLLVARAMKQALATPEPVAGALRGADWVEKPTRAGTVRIPQRVLWVPGGELEAEDRDLWGYDHLLQVWEHPTNDRSQEGVPEAERRPDGQYVVFADIAQGVGTTKDARDWTAIQVLDHITRLQVARYRSRIAIHELPLLLFLVGMYYNEAILAPEVSGLGIGPTDALAKDYRYRMMYRRRRAGDDMRQDVREQLLGWETTLRTKPLMEQTFGEVLADETLLAGLRDPLTGREFTTYVSDDRGRHGAQQGAHDDLAMAYMGAHRVAHEMRPRDPSKKRAGRRRIVDDHLTGY